MASPGPKNDLADKLTNEDFSQVEMKTAFGAQVGRLRF